MAASFSLRKSLPRTAKLALGALLFGQVPDHGEVPNHPTVVEDGSPADLYPARQALAPADLPLAGDGSARQVHQEDGAPNRLGDQSIAHLRVPQGAR
jgi:hypothetical protein